MKLLYALLAVCLLPVCCSCKKATEEPITTSDSEASIQQEENPDPSSLNKITGKVSDLYDKAASTGGATTENVKQWLGDRTGDATSKGQEISQDTVDWLTSVYETAKESGETTAGSAKDWLMDDIKNMSGWQYKTVEILGNPANLDEQLNALGGERWECFHVENISDRRRFFFKRRPRSYARNIPVTDLLRLFPRLDSGE